MKINRQVYLRHYVYELIDPRDGVVFYVGKGSGHRSAFHERNVMNGKTNGENPHKDRVIANILAAGLRVGVNIVQNSMTEADAYTLEEKIIEKYGFRVAGGLLTNILRGGKGGSENLKWTPERTQEFSQRMMGNQINKGRIQSVEEKDQRSKSVKEAYDSGRKIPSKSYKQLGTKRSAETIEKLKKYQNNRNPDHNSNISKSLKGHVPVNKGVFGIVKNSEETKRKKSEAGKLRRDTPETIEKRRQSILLYWQRKKDNVDQ
jgi:hypothetical protein